MRSVLLAMILWTALTTETQAQVVVEISYGVDRNVETFEPELDGWLNGTVEWMSPGGWGFGLGTDHHFEGAALTASDHLGWALYLTASRAFPLGAATPYIRAGLGLGRSPCTSDTCGSGPYARGSAGIRIPLSERLRITSELGVSRVSRPFATAGLRLRL